MDAHASPVRTAEQNIGRLTLWFGAAAALLTGALVSVPAGIGMALGAALAWLNHRWLGQSLDAVARASATQADAPQARVPRGTYFKFIARYGLIGLVLYVSFTYLDVPIVSMLSGLLMLGAAAMAQGIREAVSRPH